MPEQKKQLLLVDIESPYAGDVEANVEYARRCMADSLRRGEAPLASHLLYTQPGVLRDDVPDERNLGIEAGKAWARWADLTAVYVDRGITFGMDRGISEAIVAGRSIVYRRLDEANMISGLYDEKVKMSEAEDNRIQDAKGGASSAQKTE